MPCGFSTLALPELMYENYVEESTAVIYGILGLGIVCKKRCRITSISSFFFGNVIYDG